MYFRPETYADEFFGKHGFAATPRGAVEHLSRASKLKGFRILDLSRPRQVARVVADLCRGFEFRLLHIAEHSTFPSSENLHLYYTLRRANGDMQMLDEAPVHRFEHYETAEIESYLELALSNIWGGIFYAVYQRYFVFSHDEWAYAFVPLEEAHFLQERLGAYRIAYKAAPRRISLVNQSDAD
jgi:hypothetical protein